MAPANKNIYFIITAKPLAPKGCINPGEICFIDKQRYELRKKRNATDMLPVVRMGEVCDTMLETTLLKPLKKEEAQLLLAIEPHEARLLALNDFKTLEEALQLKKGSLVYVEYNGEKLKGVIRYIGEPTKSSSKPLTGTFFGVELQDKDKGKGHSDGTFMNSTFFKCPRNSAIFTPFTSISPIHHKPSATPLQTQSPLSETSSEPLDVGDRVTFFVETNAFRGMVMNIYDTADGKMEKDEDGKQGGEKEVPLECIIKEELYRNDESEKMDTSESSETGSASNSERFTLGSMVKYLDEKLGIIRWIGILPGFSETSAGLEVVEGTGVSDGCYKGKKYFDCRPQSGLFVKLSACRTDDRGSGAYEEDYNAHNNYGSSGDVENVPPIRAEDVTKRLIGTKKGIQGHYNSCYMDSALFSVFSCSSVLDSLLFKSIQQAEKTVQNILLKNIVNPLRKEGFVSSRSVMDLRKQLQQREHCPTYTTDEKDPEEFLSFIMEKILSLDPLLNLCQSENRHIVQSCYYYQIFMDCNHHLVLPTVQQLLEHSFYSNSLKLAEVPSCLILTMPRSGKSFKMFPKIIPSMELDITGLLAEGPQQCMLCGQLANEECSDCFRDSVFSNTGFKYFCSKCSTQVHSHHQRRHHKTSHLDVPYDFLYLDTHKPPREKLELFAVLCIETSHYVSFVKYGPQDTDWIFFDSMADRVGENNGYNIPEVRACPEVSQYLDMPLAQLANQVPREMKGVAKRLFCDGYMYLYQSKSMSLYR
ncbi:hypothetical protein DNTS_035454 [Danionella cerebrum]|uniref:Ubiquitin carboxyl-terminal hydrolase CYLD n=1 Tax=Danionella cerebrum TaxID=2873325 RepID=A0A553QPP4_9TELE|nr:hypothetical protein DNTS_035454 [Danionella translucida]